MLTFFLNLYIQVLSIRS